MDCKNVSVNQKLSQYDYEKIEIPLKKYSKKRSSLMKMEHVELYESYINRYIQGSVDSDIM